MSDNNAPLSIKQKEQRWTYVMDIAGNNVPVPLVEGIDYTTLPTITTLYKPKRERSVSPCPCKSFECQEDFKKIKFETLTTQKEATLPHASGIYLFKVNSNVGGNVILNS
jgi:hypothetical protein